LEKKKGPERAEKEESPKAPQKQGPEQRDKYAKLSCERMSMKESLEKRGLKIEELELKERKKKEINEAYEHYPLPESQMDGTLSSEGRREQD